MTRARLVVAAAAAATVLAGFMLVTGGAEGGQADTGQAGCVITPASSLTVPSGPRVAANVQTVIAVGRSKNVSVPGIEVAIAVILVESGGLNLASRAVPESMKYPNDGVVPGDHASINLFQQQVGMGWFDTVAHGMQVPVSAASFFDRLNAVPNWQLLGFGGAAQAVQRSAFPGRYAQRQADAVALYNRYASAATTFVPASTNPVCQQSNTGPVVLSGSWANPLKPAPYIVGSPFGMRMDPVLGIWKMHKGQDLMVASGTPVHAECTGVVQLAGWDPYGGGNMTTLNCGGGITIKNMHQSKLIAPTGTHVTAGQVIGLSGSTGHSTGPHLHEQDEINGIPTDPIPFMRARGVPL